MNVLVTHQQHHCEGKSCYSYCMSRQGWTNLNVWLKTATCTQLATLMSLWIFIIIPGGRLWWSPRSRKALSSRHCHRPAAGAGSVLPPVQFCPLPRSRVSDTASHTRHSWLNRSIWGRWQKTSSQVSLGHMCCLSSISLAYITKITLPIKMRLTRGILTSLSDMIVGDPETLFTGGTNPYNIYFRRCLDLSLDDMKNI